MTDSQLIPPWQLKFEAIKNQIVLRLPGILFCLLIVLAANYLTETYGMSVILGALLLGMSFNSIYRQPEFATGLDFCSKHVLRLGVALLGFRITFAQVTQLGWWPFIIVLIVVISTISFSLLLGYLFKVDRVKSIISGAAVGICGVSAALAIAAVLPSSKENEKHLLCTVVAVTGVSTLCMIFYPGLLTSLNLDAEQIGIFLGASIHDVAQVFGAGKMISPEVSQLATYTKMLRVAMLVPVIMLLAILFRGQGVEGSIISRGLPWFLIAFIFFMLLANFSLIKPAAIEFFDRLSSYCLWVAMAALGAKTNLVDLWHVGRKPFVLLVGNTILIAVLALVLILQIA